MLIIHSAKRILFGTSCPVRFPSTLRIAQRQFSRDEKRVAASSRVLAELRKENYYPVGLGKSMEIGGDDVPLKSLTTAAAVTSESKHQSYSLIEGWCDLRSEKNSCSCQKARYESKCASCRSDIHPGHCIVRHENYGWVHMRCQNTLLETASGELLPRSDAGIEGDEQYAAMVTSKEAQDESSSFEQGETNDGISFVKIETRQGEREELNRIRVVDDDRSPTESKKDLTEEQKAILDYEPSQCETIRINALAGCGKTASLALLCRNLTDRLGPTAKILYVVFGAQARIDASSRFPENVKVLTSHSFAKQRLLGKKTNFEPVGKIPQKNVVEVLNLESFVKGIFPQNGKKETVRISMAIASIVIKTLTSFQWSKSEEIQECHVPSNAQCTPETSKRSAWKEHVSKKDYVSWATKYFCTILEYCLKPSDLTSFIAHDSYLKVFQLVLRFPKRRLLNPRLRYDRYLEKLFRGFKVEDLKFDAVLVDEAQDLTDCQADIFWGRHSMASNARIYLVGDENQRIYNFRGASKSFEKTSVNKSFPLQRSFRFGPNIAMQANVILSCCSSTGAKLQGLSADAERVVYQNSIKRGVVICRTRNGMYRYLLEHQPERWAFHNKGEKLIKPDEKLLRLKDFVKKFVPMFGDYGPARPQIDSPFKYRATDFFTLDDLIEFCKEEDDSAMLNNIYLIYDFHKEKRGDSISEIYEKLKDSWVPDWRASVGDAGINDFDGPILVTAHGSKGLEFDDVLIHNDFQFDMLLKNLDGSTFADTGSVREEAHCIYVAMTRAKKTLFLCKEAASFINRLETYKSGDLDDDAEHAWASLSSWLQTMPFESDGA